MKGRERGGSNEEGQSKYERSKTADELLAEVVTGSATIEEQDLRRDPNRSHPDDQKEEYQRPHRLRGRAIIYSQQAADPLPQPRGWSKRMSRGELHMILARAAVPLSWVAIPAFVGYVVLLERKKSSEGAKSNLPATAASSVVSREQKPIPSGIIKTSEVKEKNGAQLVMEKDGELPYQINYRSESAVLEELSSYLLGSKIYQWHAVLLPQIPTQAGEKYQGIEVEQIEKPKEVTAVSLESGSEATVEARVHRMADKFIVYLSVYNMDNAGRLDLSQLSEKDQEAINRHISATIVRLTLKQIWPALKNPDQTIPVLFAGANTGVKPAFEIKPSPSLSTNTGLLGGVSREGSSAG